MEEMQYNVKYIRSVGLTCKWGKTRTGAPMIFAQAISAGQVFWCAIHNSLWERAKVVGLPEAFAEETALVACFYVPA